MAKKACKKIKPAPQEETAHNPTGRPPFYDTPEDIEAACDAYFISCELNEEPYTVTGLALYLGFSSRQGLDETAKRKGFLDPIKRAKLRVECSYEKSLRGNNAAGPIFALKNFGWEDRQQRDINGGISIYDRIKAAKEREKAK